MIIYLETGLIGDSLATLPAVWEQVQNEKVFLKSQNKEVSSFLPSHMNLVHVDEIESAADITLNASHTFSRCIGNGEHMSQGHFFFLGLPIPQEVPTIEFALHPTKEAVGFDFLVAAGSNSDSNNNKKWPFENWQVVIDWLREQGYTVGSLSGGSEADPIFSNCVNIMGQSLHDVANEILNVKLAVLTVDNGISHLTRMLKAPHVLIYPQCLPLHFVGNKDALTIRGEPLHIKIDDVENLINQMIEKHVLLHK